MTKTNIFLFCAVTVVLSFAGCSTPERNVMPGAMPPVPAEAAVATGRTKQFCAITAAFKTRGVGIYPEAFAGRYTPVEIAGRIQALGFNRAYCCITTEKSLNDQLIALLRELDKRNIAAEIVIYQRDYYRRVHTNQLLRSLVFYQYPTMKEVIQKVIEFNNELPEDVKKLAGITVVAGAHEFTNANVERSHGQLYAWDDKRYGIGKDNDMLMQQLFTLLQEIAALPGLPALTIAIPDFYHEKAISGELSRGTVNDFRKIGKVMVINSGNVATKLVKQSVDELKYSNGKPLIIAITLAGHTAKKEGKLRRRDWNDFCRTLDYAGKNFRQYPAFDGVVVSPLAVIEFLRQEK